MASARSDSRIVVISNTGRIAYSLDGTTWVNRSPIHTSNSDLKCVIWTGTQFMIGASDGKIFVSQDGHSWTLRPGLSNTEWLAGSPVTALVKTPYGIIAGGYYGRIARTLDEGITWQWITNLSQSGFGSNAVSKLVLNGDSIIAVGGTGHIGISPNGTSWSYSNSLKTNGWTNTSAANTAYIGLGKFMVGGVSGEFAHT